MKILKTIVDKLIAKQLTISTCESATCGYLSALFGSIPGVSKVFKGGLVTYSNSAKVLLAGIDPDLINDKGAVSEEVAEQMALNVSKILDTSIGISVTGNAGPEPMENKPVGMFYIGVSILGIVNSHQIFINKKMHRNDYISKCCETILEIINDILKISDKK